MSELANAPASLCATALPGASTALLSNDSFIVVGQHILGLGMPLQVEMQPCLCGVDNAEIMQWHATKRKGRQRYTMISRLQPGAMPSVAQFAHQARGQPIAVLQLVTRATLACVIATSSQSCLVAALRFWIVSMASACF